MFYRVRQFITTLNPQPLSSEELHWVHALLPSSALPLFFQQSQAEQRHALAVARDLAGGLGDCGIASTHRDKAPQEELEAKAPFCADRRKDLLIAALLHDCGKARSPLSLWQRVYIVLAQMSPKPLRIRLELAPPFLSAPLRVANQHAEWGADFLRQAGLREDIVRLVRYHHNPTTADEKLLWAADSRN